MSKYKELNIWQLAMDIAEDTYKITDNYPDHEKYMLISHTRKSAISIPSNIAEGRGRKSDVELNRFLNIAIGSAYELETQLELAFRLKYLTEDNKNTICDKIALFLKQTQTLQHKLKE